MALVARIAVVPTFGFVFLLSGTYGYADTSRIHICPDRNVYFVLRDGQGRRTGLLPFIDKDFEGVRATELQSFLPPDVRGAEEIPQTHIFDANMVNEVRGPEEEPGKGVIVERRWSIGLEPASVGEFDLLIRGKEAKDFHLGIFAWPYGGGTPVHTWFMHGIIRPGREYHYRLVRTTSYPMVVEFTPLNYIFQGFDHPFSREKAVEAAVGDKLRISFLLARLDGGPDSDAEARLFLKKEEEGAELTEARSADGPERGNSFLYSFLKPAERGRFAFRWDTSGLSPGTWKLIVRLDDGMEETVPVKLR